MGKEIATFIVNGHSYETIIEPCMTLLQVLRDTLGLTGTKHVCGAGDCGACTVLIEGKPVCSCLTLAVTARDKQIATIEGLADGTTLHPIQRAFIDHGAVQCGFCTPGMILRAHGLLLKKNTPSRLEIRRALSANLCRCTGYQQIIDAVEAAAPFYRQEATEVKR